MNIENDPLKIAIAARLKVKATVLDTETEPLDENILEELGLPKYKNASEMSTEDRNRYYEALHGESKDDPNEPDVPAMSPADDPFYTYDPTRPETYKGDDATRDTEHPDKAGREYWQFEPSTLKEILEEEHERSSPSSADPRVESYSPLDDMKRIYEEGVASGAGGDKFLLEQIENVYLPELNRWIEDKEERESESAGKKRDAYWEGDEGDLLVSFIDSDPSVKDQVEGRAPMDESVLHTVVNLITNSASKENSEAQKELTAKAVADSEAAASQMAEKHLNESMSMLQKFYDEAQKNPEKDPIMEFWKWGEKVEHRIDSRNEKEMNDRIENVREILRGTIDLMMEDRRDRTTDAVREKYKALEAEELAKDPDALDDPDKIEEKTEKKIGQDIRDDLTQYYTSVINEMKQEAGYAIQDIKSSWDKASSPFKAVVEAVFSQSPKGLSPEMAQVRAGFESTFGEDFTALADYAFNEHKKEMEEKKLLHRPKPATWQRAEKTQQIWDWNESDPAFPLIRDFIMEGEGTVGVELSRDKTQKYYERAKRLYDYHRNRNESATELILNWPNRLRQSNVVNWDEVDKLEKKYEGKSEGPEIEPGSLGREKWRPAYDWEYQEIARRNVFEALQQGPSGRDTDSMLQRFFKFPLDSSEASEILDEHAETWIRQKMNWIRLEKELIRDLYSKHSGDKVVHEDLFEKETLESIADAVISKLDRVLGPISTIEELEKRVPKEVREELEEMYSVASEFRDTGRAERFQSSPIDSEHTTMREWDKSKEDTVEEKGAHRSYEPGAGKTRKDWESEGADTLHTSDSIRQTVERLPGSKNISWDALEELGLADKVYEAAPGRPGQEPDERAREKWEQEVALRKIPGLSEDEQAAYEAKREENLGNLAAPGEKKKEDMRREYEKNTERAQSAAEYMSEMHESMDIEDMGRKLASVFSQVQELYGESSFKLGQALIPFERDLREAEENLKEAEGKNDLHEAKRLKGEVDRLSGEVDRLTSKMEAARRQEERPINQALKDHVYPRLAEAFPDLTEYIQLYAEVEELDKKRKSYIDEYESAETQPGHAPGDPRREIEGDPTGKKKKEFSPTKSVDIGELKKDISEITRELAAATDPKEIEKLDSDLAMLEEKLAETDTAKFVPSITDPTKKKMKTEQEASPIVPPVDVVSSILDNARSALSESGEVMSVNIPPSEMFISNIEKALGTKVSTRDSY